VGEDIKFVFNTFGFRVKRRITGTGRATHECEETPYYRLGLVKRFPFAPVLTGRGCPYRCTYCASHLLHDGFIQRDPLDVTKEIGELHALGVRDYAFYDDALLLRSDSQIKVILKDIIRRGIEARFHCPNGLHARFIDNEIARLMKQSGFKTLRLSLETSQPERQYLTGGKVTSQDLTHAVTTLRKNGFEKEDIGVYLMYGLPGQDLQEVNEGVEFLKSLRVRIQLTEFSPIPGTRCWKELLDKGVIRDSIDPLLTNNTIFSFLYSGYDPGEVEKLKLAVREYNCRLDASVA
jgi:radical SAM superfamily enzyme YgiQ (UPF0313 family)